MSKTEFPRAGFFRRIAAIVYDSLVITAVVMFAAGLALAVSVALDSAQLLPLATDVDHAERIADTLVFRIYLVLVIVTFYAGFWSRGGQTLGMKAWRLRVQGLDGKRISFRQGVVRFFTSLVGLGNFLVLFHPNNQALQDLAAKCEVVVLTPEANQHKNWA
ncbi:MAG: RDD family protein [Idiomarina sp.]|nr:RDD family protein [Idiomarina sp.]